MDQTSYRCAVCGGTFTTERPDAEAEAEAEAIWGVANASTNPDMAVVCDDCFRAGMARMAPEDLPKV